MKRALVVVVALSFAAATRAAERLLELDPARSSVSFTLGGTFHTVHGVFRVTRGTVRFDTTTGAASGEIVVDTRSGSSDNAGRDGKMKRDVLESEAYPEATLVPDHVEGTLPVEGESTLSVHGMLHLHGGEHELTLSLSTRVRGDEIEVATEFTVPYKNWGMKDPSVFLFRVDDHVD